MTPARIAAAALLLALAGCTLLDPYETVPLAPAAADGRPRVGICYDELVNDSARVLAEAQDACGPGATPIRADTDLGLESMQVCPLLLPGRATFICAPKK